MSWTPARLRGMRSRLIVFALLVAVMLAAAALALSGGASTSTAGWTWDEDSPAFVAGPHEGSDF